MPTARACGRTPAARPAGPMSRPPSWTSSSEAMTPRLLSSIALLALSLALARPARADFYIVVHASNPQRALSQKEAVDLFMGRSRAFGNGDFALIFDLPR